MSKVYRNAMTIVDERLKKVGRAVALHGVSGVIKRTPVDTGHARANWFVGNEATAQVDEGRTPSTAVAEGSARANAWDITKNDLHISNNVPYIGRLEDGYSQQAPAGMARITVMELDELAESVGASLNRG